MMLLRIFACCFLLPAAAMAAVPRDVSKIAGQPDEWFKSDEGRQICNNILTWQNANGGWWKAYKFTEPRAPRAEKENDKAPSNDGQSTWERTSTFDNKATFSELRILARAHRVTGEQKYRDAFDRGLKFVFDSQFENGGWPQRFPLENNYGRHITYNDGAMTGVMYVLKDIAEAKPDFAFLSPDVRKHASDSFDRGVECILNSQIRVNGKLTAWCQQHDEKTLAPTSARTYELPCITAGESSDVLFTLMRIENPNERVKESIRSAVKWLEASKIMGKRLVDQKDPATGEKDRVIIDDPTAPPQWARFYDIETNRPFYCGRDGVKKWSLAEIEIERRAGYAWLRPFAARVMTEYPKWEAKQKETAR